MIETRKAGIIEVNTRGVTVRLQGRKNEQTIGWDELRDATEANGELTAYYADLLHRAEERVLTTLPVSIQYGYINTNVYGVYGEGVDGKLRQIRAWDLSYWPMSWVAAAEGISLYSLADAKKEAEDIAARIGKIWPSHKPMVYRHPSLWVGYAC